MSGNPQFNSDLAVPFIVPRHLSDNELREWLKDKMALIDATKRHIRDQLSRYSHETEKKTQEDFRWIRRAKAKQSHLTEERERLRKILGETNVRMKTDRALKNKMGKRSLKYKLSDCFMVAAEDLLDPDLFQEIEQRAMSLLKV